MGEHISYLYTNTFRVRDRSAFEAFCRKNHLTPFSAEGGEGSPELVGCWGESALDALITEENALLESLAGQLAAGQVAIVIDVAYFSEEHLEGDLPPRGVWAIAHAVGSRGEIITINTGDICERAQALGEAPTRPRWM
jgi:hypothetical protein